MPILKKTLLFVIGLTGVAGAGWWFVRGGGTEAVLLFLASLGALLADFFWTSASRLSKASLTKKPKDELRTIARSLRVPGFSSMSKDQLINEIDSFQKERRGFGYRWSTLRWLALLLAIGAIPALDWLFPEAEDIPPRYDLAWYEMTEGGPTLVEPGNVQMFYDHEDIFANRIRLPIQLAIRNAENVPLKVVRVELHYPRGLNVTSDGRAKLDPDNQLFIYEHMIGTLEQVDEYTILETVDVITIPYRIFLTPVVVIAADGVPQYLLTIVGEGAIVDSRVAFRFRVFCEGRPPVNGVLRIKLAAKVDMIPDLDDSKLTNVNEDDMKYFHADFPDEVVATQWRRIMQPEGTHVEYRRIKCKLGTLQLVSANDLLRKVIVDNDSDGAVEFALVDTDGDQEPDQKYVFDSFWPVADWKPEGVR